MRFGMLPYRHGSVSEDVNLAKLAEENSFDSYWVPDSILSRDAYVSLAQIAAHTKRLFIGAESGPYIRHPVVTANAVAALDEFSGGRVGLMMAVGHLRSNPSLQGRLEWRKF
jgi:5,10-methylenetetrahydromethanopterin reductase